MNRPKISSTPLPAEPSELSGGRSTIVMALDTFVDQKGLVVGLTEGVVHGPDIPGVTLSAVGDLIVERCARHLKRNYPEGDVIVAGVKDVARAKQRVRQVLTKAPPGSFVLLVCADGKVYDAAHAALGIDLQAANQSPH